jgi:hypothetical protein
MFQTFQIKKFKIVNLKFRISRMEAPSTYVHDRKSRLYLAL